MKFIQCVFTRLCYIIPFNIVVNKPHVLLNFPASLFILLLVLNSLLTSLNQIAFSFSFVWMVLLWIPIWSNLTAKGIIDFKKFYFVVWSSLSSLILYFSWWSAHLLTCSIFCLSFLSSETNSIIQNCHLLFYTGI